VGDQLTQDTSSDLDAVLPPRSQLERSLQPLTRAGRESYAVKTMVLCLALRLLLLPRKGE